MQDDIINTENRLEKLKRPININYNNDDETGRPGGGGGDDGGGDDGTPPRPPTRTRRDDGFDELTKRLNRLHSPAYPPRPPKPNPRGIDMHDVLTKRLNRLRYGETMPTLEEKTLAKRLAERNRDLSQLPKGAVKARRSDIGLFQPVLPDTSPPTPDRNDYWPPHPVVPADNNFIKPQLLPKPKLPAKPQLPPKLLLDEFPRPLTKTIVAKKNKIKIIPKKEVSINETSLSEKLTKIFRNIDEVEKEKQDDKKYVEEVKNRTEILSKAGEDETPFEFEFFTGGKNKNFDDICHGLGLSSDNLEFLDFLQSDGCKKIFVSNNFKIHI